VVVLPIFTEILWDKAACEKKVNRKMEIKTDKHFFIVIPPQLLSLVTKGNVNALFTIIQQYIVYFDIFGEESDEKFRNLMKR